MVSRGFFHKSEPIPTQKLFMVLAINAELLQSLSFITLFPCNKVQKLRSSFCVLGACGGNHDNWWWNQVIHSDVWEPSGSAETESVRLHDIYCRFIWHNMVRGIFHLLSLAWLLHDFCVPQTVSKQCRRLAIMPVDLLSCREFLL